MEKLIINSILEDFNLESEANSEIGQNPSFSWARLIVCDDAPNANKQRIPAEEFDNIIKTGIFTPVKMAEGKISSHEEAWGKAIGVISQMKKDGNTVKALAAFWNRERGGDVELLKEMIGKGELPQVSWELAYDSSISEVAEDGIQNLRGIALNGTTVVANPAYKGRTPIYELAEEKEEDKKMEKTIEELQAELTEKEQALIEKDKIIQQKEEELIQLREFKQSVEQEAELLTKMDNIKKKFEEAGIQKESQYFEDNKERFLKLDEGDLDFFIQELVAFSSTSTSKSEEEGSDVNIPNFNSTNLTKENPKQLAKALKEMKKSKKE